MGFELRVLALAPEYNKPIGPLTDEKTIKQLKAEARVYDLSHAGS